MRSFVRVRSFPPELSNPPPSPSFFSLLPLPTSSPSPSFFSSSPSFFSLHLFLLPFQWIFAPTSHRRRLSERNIWPGRNREPDMCVGVAWFREFGAFANRNLPSWNGRNIENVSVLWAEFLIKIVWASYFNVCATSETMAHRPRVARAQPRFRIPRGSCCPLPRRRGSLRKPRRPPPPPPPRGHPARFLTDPATGRQRRLRPVRPRGEKERRQTWAFQCGSLCQGAAAAAAAEARRKRGAAFSGYFYL